MPATMYKLKSTTVIPGTPGRAAIPGTNAVPGTPEHTVQTDSLRQVCVPNPVCDPDLLNTPDNDNQQSVEMVPGYEPSPCNPSVICRTIGIITTTTIPAVPGTPGTTGTPAVPGTPAQFIEHFNEGWNSWARSIDEMNVNSYLSYSIESGVRGILVALGVPGKAGDSINSFSHAILVDPGGVSVMEYGEVVQILKYSYSPDTNLRLYRQPDNQVIAVVTNPTETVVYIFSADAHLLSSIPMHAYCYIYRGDDSIIGSKIRNDNPVQFGQA